VSRPGRALPPGKEPPIPIVQEAGWAPEPVWTQRLEEKSSAPVGDRTSVVQSVTIPTELPRLLIIIIIIIIIIAKIKLFLDASRHADVWGSGGIDPRILNLRCSG
jgi:hypothetical protein